MRKILLLLLLAVLPAITFADVIKMSLSEALKTKSVKMEAASINGNYNGKALKISLSNTTGDKLEITVDLGMILKPYVPSFQPLVLAGEETLALKSHGKGDVDVQVFCGNAPKACPIKDLTYSYLKMGSDTLVKVLRFIKENDLYNHLGQSAVWAVTNNHSLHDVYDPMKDAVSKKLIDVLAQATGKAKPTYYVVKEVNETPAQPAYSAKMLKIIIPFDVKLGASTVITVSAYEPKGNLVKNLIDRKMFTAGMHNLMIDFDPAEFDPGKYTIKVATPEKILQEKEVTVE